MPPEPSTQYHVLILGSLQAADGAHANDDIVNSIIASKVAMGHYRLHSDLPEDEHAVLYYVLVDMSYASEHEAEDKISASASAEAEGGSEAGCNVL